MKNDKMNKFLIIRLSSIGDVLLTTPFLKLIKNNFPNSKIDFLVEDKAANIINNNPYINNVIIFNKSKLKEVYKEKGTLTSLKYIFKFINKKVKSENYDLIFDLHSVFRSKLMSSFANGNKRIGFDKQKCSFFYNKKFIFSKEKHIVDNYLKLLEPLELNIKKDEIKFSIYISEENKLNAKKLLKKFDLKKIIILF